MRCFSFKGGAGIGWRRGGVGGLQTYRGRKWFMSFPFPPRSAFICVPATHNNKHSSNPCQSLGRMKPQESSLHQPPPESGPYVGIHLFLKRTSLRIILISFLLYSGYFGERGLSIFNPHRSAFLPVLGVCL